MTSKVWTTRASRVLAAAALLICSPAFAHDTQTPPTAWPEIETENLFGFTEGTDIGEEGEKEFFVQTNGRFGKADGSYRAFDHKVGFGYTPSQFFNLEFGLLGASHSIRNVPGLDNRDTTQFAGVFGEIKYLLIGRGPGSPFGLSISVEPEWGRVDDTSGERVSKFELETRLTADTALIEDRLFWAISLLYEPEVVKPAGEDTERESNLGFSTALTYRFTPQVAAGAELQYIRHYSGTGLNVFEGDALYLGPTFLFRINNKTSLTAAWATQVSGRVVGEPGSLNLDEFDRQRGKLKLNVEF